MNKKTKTADLIKEYEAIVQEEEMAGISMNDRVRKEELREELSVRGFYFTY